MALKKDVVSPQGFEVSGAYHKVANVSLAGKTQINFSVQTYVSVDFRNFDEVSYSCSYDLEGSNPIAQAYAYLKSLDEFSGAVDA